MVTKRVERVYDDDGTLTPDGIERLVRRIWWGEYDEVRDRAGWRVKWTHLRLWWAVEKWPAWWPIGMWIDCGDSLEARTEPQSGLLFVRRRWGGRRQIRPAVASQLMAGC